MEEGQQTESGAEAPTRARKAKAKPKKAAKKVKGKAAKKSKGEGRPRTGVGETIKGMIAKSPNKTNAEIAEMAKKKHPDSSTNAACVAWYRSQGSKKSGKKSKK